MSKIPHLKLVGAGPGDPELITLKALKAILDSDVILYDSLLCPRIFDLAFSDSMLIAFAEAGWKKPELVFVGKRRGESALQDNINDLILRYLQRGKVVTRLKGGDPFVFARAQEEIAVARENGFDVELIPGLTSGIAVPSMHGIPLTLRNQCDTLTLSSGHDLNEEKLEKWKQLIESGSTLVVYMGLFKVVDICNSLKEKLEFDCPAVAISNGSLADEKIVKAKISNLSQEIINKQLQSPAILIFARHLSSLRPASNSSLFSTVDFKSEIKAKS